jgi:hypothetical protein
MPTKYRVNEPCLFPMDQVPGGCQPPYVAVEVYKAADIDPLLPKWTTEKPTVPGWYWWRANGKDDSIVRLIETQEGGLIVQFETGHCAYVRNVPDGEWAGPLTPPSDGEGT